MSRPLTARPHKVSRTDVSDADDDEAETLLLGELNRGHTAGDYDSESAEDPMKTKAQRHFSKEDKQGMALLCVLYLIQGVPTGLTLGSIPFILRAHLSYSQLGIFALSAYPYCFKLLWSPIIDSIFSRKIGRRKSWIIPLQLIIGTLMLWIAQNSEELLDSPENHVGWLTAVFTLLVFFAVTQDIAVDGWALTLLSPENLPYASTCQTFGLNTGYFISFTVFLALNSEDFARNMGIAPLTLRLYLQFWAFVCYSVTLWLLFVTKEAPPSREDDHMDLWQVYRVLWSVCKLQHVQALCIMHFFSKIGAQANEAVTHLKMVEKGLKKEDMAFSMLFDFPFKLVGSYLAARWSRGERPLESWIWSFWGRLLIAVLAMVMIAVFPLPPIPMSFFALIVILNITESFTSEVQFVGISAFHTRVSDPVIGGTYMTLLSTANNIGGTWPRYFVLRGVDVFSVATCKASGGAEPVLKAAECVSEQGKKSCDDIGGACIIERDGYYYVSSICITVGVLILFFYMSPTARKLQALPVSKWRVPLDR